MYTQSNKDFGEQLKLQEYFPSFYTKTQMEKVLFQLLEDWKKQTEQSEE